MKRNKRRGGKKKSKEQKQKSPQTQTKNNLLFLSSLLPQHLRSSMVVQYSSWNFPFTNCCARDDFPIWRVAQKKRWKKIDRKGERQGGKKKTRTLTNSGEAKQGDLSYAHHSVVKEEQEREYERNETKGYLPPLPFTWIARERERKSKERQGPLKLIHGWEVRKRELKRERGRERGGKKMTLSNP